MADQRSVDLVGGSAVYQGVSGRAAILTATVTLPGNTQYHAGDQVANSASAPVALAFANAAFAKGGGGRIVSAVCVDNVAQAAFPSFKLRLYSGSPTLANDHAAWAPSDADLAKIIPGGEIQFAGWATALAGAGSAGNAYAFGSVQTGLALNIPYRCGATSTTLYGDVQELGTYTPLYDQLTVRLGVIRD